MDVEWDEKKRLSNLPGCSSDFLEPFLEAEDLRAEYGEQRFRALGHVGRDYFLVAYTWRGERRRIISAWKVDDEGRQRYAAILAGSTQGGA
jgi:uncharacterized DUF497 family protein